MTQMYYFMYKSCYKWKIKSFFPANGKDTFDPGFYSSATHGFFTNTKLSGFCHDSLNEKA